ncbi:exosome complex component RRP41-like [Durio zibethinus]|uniref:Exosome complex component RRP41-like n=1 Tax=Durio zibethinus TaxID=66656 RepID=A0A6P5ZJ32_DURZI|nr:exosome complex component RRP41-like [Durio zibethinus]
MLYKALEGAMMLETFPKTTVDVFALVLESGGINDLPVVKSCASLALADAGIMIYDLVAVVFVASFFVYVLHSRIKHYDHCAHGSLMLSCMPSCYEITQLTFTGEPSTAYINEAMQLCLDACNKLGRVMRSCLKEAASASQ